MPSTMLDSVFFKDIFGSKAMRAVFDDLNLLQMWLDFEAALARAEAKLGLIPASAAEEITRRAQAHNFDTIAIKNGIDDTVHPLVSTIWQLAERCEGDAGRYVHWGATTQDVMDTAIIMQLRSALALIEETLAELCAAMTSLASTHKNTPMVGRTHGQHALPITFGFKVAVWLAELKRHQERLSEVKKRLLVGEFGGAVGTLAGLIELDGVDGMAVQAALMDELQLGVPTIAWHSSRDNIAEFSTIISMLAASMGRIAHEIIDLQKNEFREVEEPFVHGKIGSSTMPQKRNPMICESILTLGRLCREKAATAIDTVLYNEHERDWSSFQMEWAYLPELCIMGHGAMELTLRVIQGLHVYPEHMRRNMDSSKGLLLAERVMFALGQHLGRQVAHDVVYACAMDAFEKNQPLIDSLVANERVMTYLGAEALAQLLDPEQYTGLASQFVERVLHSK